MKYIRTEEGIYEDAGTDALGFRCVRYNGHKIALSKEDDKIVKEADDIEKLFDEYAMESKDHSYWTLLAKYRDHNRSLSDGLTEDIRGGWLNYCVEYLQKGFAIYGAIRTDKGLIYVAKMNEKEKWDLL